MSPCCAPAATACSTRGDPSHRWFATEKLPFADDHFDRVSVAFGLRNMTHKEQGRGRNAPGVKPGGKLLVLEFSRGARAVGKGI